MIRNRLSATSKEKSSGLERVGSHFTTSHSSCSRTKRTFNQYWYHEWRRAPLLIYC